MDPVSVRTRELRRSWLVQRLTQPSHRNGIFGKDTPFSFGGGLLNGGLSSAAMELLRGIFAFDYMGAAEFEFGAVPEALEAMAKADLVAFSFDISLSEVEANWRDKSKTVPSGDATIYVLAPAEWVVEIERRIRAWAAGSHDDELRLKESTRLSSALRPMEEWDRDTCGWLEISNGYMFFTDEAMWQKTCALFGVVA